MVRYYGFYSNVSRGKRQKSAEDDDIPCILESEEEAKAHRKNGSRLIQKIYETDLLICPQCKGTMRIIRSIDDQKVIRDILKHLGLWLVKARPHRPLNAKWCDNCAPRRRKRCINPDQENDNRGEFQVGQGEDGYSKK